MVTMITTIALMYQTEVMMATMTIHTYPGTAAQGDLMDQIQCTMATTAHVERNCPPLEAILCAFLFCQPDSLTSVYWST